MRTLVLTASSAVAALAVLLGVTVTPWALLAVPFCIVAGFAAWVGLDLERFAQAVGDDEPGRGTPGLLP